jgi:hypothetical protein
MPEKIRGVKVADGAAGMGRLRLAKADEPA